IIVKPGGKRALLVVLNSCLCGNILIMGHVAWLSFVSKQVLRSIECRYEDIGPTVIIVIGGCYSFYKVADIAVRFFGHVGEGAVVIVDVQHAGMYPANILRTEVFGTYKR